MADFDCIIIGGGLSGLAAGARMAHFGRRVAIFEAHGVPGGLNSWYRRGERIVDTGLHAMTNFVPPTEPSAPLNRILRQLRISRAELELCPQTHSAIVMPGMRLRLENDFPGFVAQLKGHFPQCAAGIDAAIARIDECGYRMDGAAPAGATARSVLMECTGGNRRLTDLLCLPVMYYGNPQEGDMDFASFAVMFKSVLQEGLCRPRNGIQSLIGALRRRFEADGGLLCCGRPVRSLEAEDAADTRGAHRIAAVTDARGERHAAPLILSTIGGAETLALVSDDGGYAAQSPLAACRDGGRPGFIECIFEAQRAPAELGFTECVEFNCLAERFEFRPPENALSAPESLLICAPGNYSGCDGNDRVFRVSCLTDAAFWLDAACPEEDYRRRKAEMAQRCLEAVAGLYPALAEGAHSRDMYTPRTFRRFTGHRNGGIYGSPDKLLDGATGWSNLRLAGTDQGLCGIVGSMLSGILAANAMLASS